MITVAEVKSFLNISDSIVDKEETTIDTCLYKRLAFKPVGSIYRVDTDTEWSTASAYTTADYYTTEDYSGYTLFRRIDTGTIGTTEVVYISYSYSDYDDIIRVLIPQVENDLCSWLNNYFEDKQTRYEMGSYKILARAGSSHPQITDTENQYFLKYGLDDGMDIYVDGTWRNNGIYTISSAAAGVLKLSSGDTCLQETDTDWYGGSVRVSRIKWPVEIKKIVAQIIWFNIERSKNIGIQSRSLGPSSITYAQLESGGYPPSLYNALSKYKYTKVK